MGAETLNGCEFSTMVCRVLENDCRRANLTMLGIPAKRFRLARNRDTMKPDTLQRQETDLRCSAGWTGGFASRSSWRTRPGSTSWTTENTVESGAGAVPLARISHTEAE